MSGSRRCTASLKISIRFMEELNKIIKADKRGFSALAFCL